MDGKTCYRSTLSSAVSASPHRRTQWTGSICQSHDACVYKLRGSSWCGSWRVLIQNTTWLLCWSTILLDTRDSDTDDYTFFQFLIVLSDVSGKWTVLASERLAVGRDMPLPPLIPNNSYNCYDGGYWLTVLFNVKNVNVFCFIEHLYVNSAQSNGRCWHPSSESWWGQVEVGGYEDRYANELQDGRRTVGCWNSGLITSTLYFCHVMI